MTVLNYKLQTWTDDIEELIKVTIWNRVLLEKQKLVLLVKKFPLLWNPKAKYHVHKNLLLVITYPVPEEAAHALKPL
jgi:hypothetical protein